MTRPICFGLCACLSLSLAAITCGSSNSGSGWDQARIGNTGTNYEINAQKGGYFFAAQISPEDATAQSTLVTLVQTAVANANSNPTAAPLSLIPALSEVPGTGWTLDTNAAFQVPTGVGSASGSQVQTGATDLVDGGSDPFFANGYQPKAMAVEYLTNGNYSVKIQIWNMGSTGDATKLYTSMLSDSFYNQDNNAWVTCTATTCPTP